MRVLLVNAFHYLKGGVERTYLDESRWLAGAGHEVCHFATRHPRNLPSPTSEHFAPAADYDAATPLGQQLRQLPRTLWSAPAADAMMSLLDAFRPDVAHIHAPSRYLTPSFLRPLERAGVPVVMTLHDFKPWCTNRILFANGQPCERCRGGAHWHATQVGCVQGSRLKSAVGSAEAYLHDLLDAYRSVRLWIAPSRFVFDKAVTFGLDPERVRVLGHGVDAPASIVEGSSVDVPRGPYVFFSGRLSVEKGVALLPEIASAIAEVPLLVAGEGPLRGFLTEATKRAPNLRPLGHLSDAHLALLRAHASVVVVPSLFYEHFCYAAAEALLDGRIVVAASIGAIPELVEHEVTGLLATAGDGAALGAAVRRALDDANAPSWAAAGRNRVAAGSRPEQHLDGLVRIYREVGA